MDVFILSSVLRLDVHANGPLTRGSPQKSRLTLLVPERSRSVGGRADMVGGVRQDRAAGIDRQLVRCVVERRQIEDANDTGLSGAAGKHAKLLVVVGSAVDDVHLGAADARREDHVSVE